MGPRARVALLGAALLLTACAAPPGQPEWDPWEGFNRKVFWLNERFDEYALEPTARGWQAITSTGVRESVADFTDNLLFPVHFVNDVLQLRLADAGCTTWRFLINTTMGVLGLFDPATSLGLPPKRADFGQTLAHWGVDEGPYLVLPFFGPSNPRDALGLYADLRVARFMPLSNDAFLALGVLRTVNWRTLHLKDIEEAHHASFDYYAAVRSAWLGSRRRETGVIVSPDEAAPRTPSNDEEDPYDVDAATKP